MDATTVFVILIVVAVVAIGVVVGVIGMRRDKGRSSAIAAWAQSRGWTYQQEDHELARQLLPVFPKGEQRRALNVVRARTASGEVVVADFRYVTVKFEEDVNQEKTHRVSVVLRDLGIDLPQVTVAPQGAVGRLVGRVTGRDIQIGDSAFDKAFNVTAADHAVARAILTPAVRGLALQHGQRSWSVQGRRVMTWSEGEQNPQQADEAIAFLDQLSTALVSALH